MLTPRVALAAAFWPLAALALLAAGALAYTIWTTAEYCDCTNPETLSDGECLDCALPTGGVNP